MKRCTSCTIEKPLEEFYWTTRRNGDKARHSKCQECRREQFRQWQKSDGAKKIRRDGVLRRNFGLTREQYEAMYEKQNGLCAICQKEEIQIRSGSKARLSVDHHHETKQIRELLCSNCNMGIGSFSENTETMLRAVEYLKKHEKELKK